MVYKPIIKNLIFYTMTEFFISFKYFNKKIVFFNVSVKKMNKMRAFAIGFGRLLLEEQADIKASPANRKLLNVYNFSENVSSGKIHCTDVLLLILYTIIHFFLNFY